MPTVYPCVGGTTFVIRDSALFASLTSHRTNLTVASSRMRCKIQSLVGLLYPMRLGLPSSRGFFKLRLSVFNSVWAFLAPLLALWSRDAAILSYGDLLPTIIYCSVSVLFSLIAFSAFRIHDGMTRYFSVHDAINVIKAVVGRSFNCIHCGFYIDPPPGCSPFNPGHSLVDADSWSHRGADCSHVYLKQGALPLRHAGVSRPSTF